MTTTREQFAKEIKAVRVAKNISVRQVALYSGLNPSTISRLENGKNGIPKVEVLEKLATGLGISYDQIMAIAGVNTSRIASEYKIKSSTQQVPVYGYIYAGEPQGAQEDIQGMVKIPDELIEKYGQKNLIALVVSGDSMNNVIPNGAIAILYTAYKKIKNGHIYATLIDDEKATLKRVFKYEKSIRFQPDSTNENNKAWTYYEDKNNEKVIMIGELVYAIIEHIY